MSIINKMLKDLDKRKQKQPEPDSEASASPSQAEPKYTVKSVRDPRIAWAVRGGILAVLAIAFLVLFNPWQQDSQPAVPTPVASLPIVQQQQASDSESERATAGERSSDSRTPATRTENLADLQLRSEPATSANQRTPRLVAGSPSRSETVSGEAQQAATRTSESASQPQDASVVQRLNVDAVNEQQDQVRIEQAAATSTVTQSQSPAETAYRRGMRALRDGDNRTAARLFASAIAEDPASHHARVELAVIRFVDGDTAEAFALLEDGLAIAPGYNNFRQVYARMLNRAGDAHRALSLLRDAVVQLPQDLEFLVFRGALATEHQDYGLAVQSYRQLVNYRQDQGMWWLGLGYALELRGDTEDAAEAYRQALRDPRLSQDARRFLTNRREELSYSW